MAGKWVIRQKLQSSGVKLYYTRNKKMTLYRQRWSTVRTPVDATKFFRQEQAESAAFAIVAAKPDLLGKLVVVEWDGNTQSKP